MDHKEGIIKSRVGGFGGSDAAMFLKVGTKGIGSLNDSDKKRIAVALGQIEYEPIPTTKAMEAGNIFEEKISSSPEFDPWEKNPMIFGHYVLKNFRIFAHPDLYLDGNVIEIKHSKFSPAEVMKKYIAQLQWYFLLDGVKTVELLVGNSLTDDDDITLVEVKRDNRLINKIFTGIVAVDDFCDDFQYTESKTIELDQLSEDGVKVINYLAQYLSEMKIIEQKIKKSKDVILKNMLMHEIKNIQGFDFSVTLIPEGERISYDYNKMLEDNPQINVDDYKKVSKRKPYVKITTK